jgi:hypothetical protein
MAEILRHRRETRRQTDEIKPLPKLPRHLSTLPPRPLQRYECDALAILIAIRRVKSGYRLFARAFSFEPRDHLIVHSVSGVCNGRQGMAIPGIILCQDEQIFGSQRCKR